MKKIATGVALAVLVSGCATKSYVNERIAAANTRLDQQQAALDSTSRTAKEALERANAAGKLAEGKFMYEVSLSSEIAFKVNSSVLTPAAETALDAFASQLKSSNKNVYIEIQGHTDSTGAAASNLKLSQARAESVHRYLAINGKIALHRMNVIAYGETAPAADNLSHAGRVANRRVTLVVLQ